MGTPASLLDLIARGGSIPGFNEAQQSQANTALTNAQVENVPLQGALTQAQTANVGALTQEQQLKNQQLQQQLENLKIYQQAIQDSMAPPPAATNTTPNAPAPATSTPITASPGVGVQLQRRPDVTAPPVSPPQSPITTPPFVPQNGAQQSRAPNPFDDPIGFGRTLELRGGTPDFVNQVVGNHLAIQKAVLALPAEEQAAELAKLAPVQRLLEGVAILPDGPQKQLQYVLARRQIQNLDPDVAANLPANLDNQMLTSALSQVGALKEHLANAKTVQETKTSAATGESAEAEAKLKGVQAQRQQLILDSIKQGQEAQQTGQNPIDAIFPASLDPTINASYKAAYNAALSQPPDENGRRTSADSLLTAAAAHAASVRLPQNPQVIAGEAKKAAAVASATAGIDVAKEVAAARQIRAGDNPAVANVPIGSQPQVIRDAQKIDEDYIAAKGASDTLGKVIEDFRNPVAGANLASMMTAATMAVSGIKRISPAALENNEAPGSLADTIAGKLQKWGGHGPVPEDIAHDMEQLRQTMAQQAYKSYTNRLATLKRSGADFKPQFTDSGHQVGETVLVGGKPIKITEIDANGHTFKGVPANQ